MKPRTLALDLQIDRPIDAEKRTRLAPVVEGSDRTAIGRQNPVVIAHSGPLES